MKRLINAKEALRLYNSSRLLKGGYGYDFGSNCEALDKHQDTPHFASFKYRFQANHKNIQNTVHGGALSTMVDVITTVGMLRLIANRTTSISLNTEFMRPIKVEQEVQIDTEVTKLGKNIVFADCRIYTKHGHDRKLACKGQHIKAVLKDDWDFMQETKH